jgi:hypothetical protein
MIYGPRWTSSQGDLEEEMVQLWQSTLAGLTGDQVKRGLTAMMTTHKAWPPTVFEFRDLCTGAGQNEHGLNYVPQVYRQRAPMNKMLDKPRDDAAGRLQAQQLLDMLRGKRGSA